MNTSEIIASSETESAETVESTASEPTTQAETQKSAKTVKPKIDVQPVLQKLFELYPHLFGNAFLPLKLGTYQDLMVAHPEVFKKDTVSTL